GVAVAALPHGRDVATPEQQQWRALALAPLSAGSATGLRMIATDAVEPIDAAPERATVDLAMTLAAGDTVRSLLTRAGATFGDAGTAGAMIAAAAPQIEPGTKVAVTLGRSNGAARPIERVRLHAGLGLTLDIARGAGGLRLARQAVAVDRTPLRVRGRVGDGLYWSLRAAGVSPASAAEYLAALATEIDVGSDVAADDRFDLIIASRAAGGERKLGPMLYAAIDRGAERDLKLIRWASNGRLSWFDTDALAHPAQNAAAGMMWPVAGRITSSFGWRTHPILGFARLHKGIDFGASWGSPIVAAADGRVSMAGWSGGYGRQVRIAHGGGLVTSYSHMSQIAAQAGSFVHRGQVIGYVGSSGLSTGPHLHYEVLRSGTPVNPLGVTFANVVLADNHQADAIKARLRSLLSVGMKRG
ncbi:MAG: M23 family metallopeptidase, partial [Sphingomicrobium sp.]